MSTIRLTMLNSMAGDMPGALDRHVEERLEICDLKDRIYGKRLEELSDDEVAELDREITARGLKTYCLSTSLGDHDLALGEAAWIDVNHRILERVLAAAKVLKPSVVRVIAAKDTSRPQGGAGNMEMVLASYPWAPAAYDTIVARINEAGFDAVLENEAHDCIVTSPEDVLTLFAALGPKHRLKYTWDVQNMWQMGTPPSLTVLRTLLPHLGMLHLKGGRAGPDGALLDAASLADASWPVADIVRAAVDSGTIDVLCINPSHGRRSEQFDGWAVARDDLRFLRAADPRIA
jgi:sugar phosphate isomerase/epimerase